MLDTTTKIKELIYKLNLYTKAYDQGTPVVTDQEWDKLYFELFELEQETGIYLENSPTQSINYQVVNELKKVKHNHPMLSLQKTQSIEEINAFIDNKDYIIMLKIDGLTCSLGYENGILISAETRGNGIEGEDILHNAMVIQNIPKKIPFKGKLIIDGEIICKLDNFKHFEQEYKNSRNFASGSIRLLDSKECSKRKLSFIAWDVIECEEPIKRLNQKLAFLIDNHFEIVPFSIMHDFNKETIKEFQEIAVKCNIPIDGLVVKYNDCDYYESLGRTDHHFRGGIAFKFYDETYESKLLDIEWSLGRTGQITPIALFKTINIDGTDVSRASLSNLSIMKETLGKHPFEGQIIEISKRNQIIPKIERAKDENGEWIMKK